MWKVWTISDLGTAKFVRGIAISWNPELHTVALSQTTLIDKIVSQFGQTDASPLSAPLELGQKLQRVDQSTSMPDVHGKLAELPYWSLVRCLLYLTISTCPDISYAVQQLSQFLDSYSLDIAQLFAWSVTSKGLKTSNYTWEGRIPYLYRHSLTQIGQTA